MCREAQPNPWIIILQASPLERTLLPLKYLTSLFLFFSALHAAFFLRTALPLGSQLVTTPDFGPASYWWLLVAWTAASALCKLLPARDRAAGYLLGNSLLAFALSIVGFFITSVETQVFSRLFVVFLVVTNFLALLAYGWLSQLFQRNEHKLVELANNLTQLNKALYARYIEIFVALIASLIWVDYIFKMGLNLTSDSITYQEAALGLSVNGELTLSNHWPPLYPIILTATRLFTAFPADGAAIISALSVVIFFGLFALLLRAYSQYALINVLLILLLASLSAFVEIFQVALSEQVYSVFLVLHFYLLIGHQKKSHYLFFLGAVIVAGLAMLLRYAAVNMGFILVLYSLIFRHPGLATKVRLMKYAAVALLSFFPLALLIAGDYSAGGSGIGYSLLLFPIFETILASLALIWSNVGWGYLLPFLLLLFFALAFVFKGPAWERHGLLLYSSLFLTSYAGLTIAAFLTTLARPQIRYFSVFYFLLLLGIAYLIDRVQASQFPPGQKPAALRQIVLAFAVVALLLAGWNQWLQTRNVLVARPAAARNNPLQQYSVGFDVSPTAAGLARFFSETSAAHDDFTIIAIEGDYDRRIMVFEYDTRVLRTFFFRESIFGLPAFDQFAFAAVADDRQVIRYSHQGQPKQLTYLFARPESVRDWLNGVQGTALDSVDPGSVYLIINELLWEGYAEELFGSKLRPLGLVEPYRLYQAAP